MAWNRPSEDKAKAKVRGEQRNVHLKGLLAGMIVVLGAAFAAWWLWPRGGSAGETPQSETKPTRVQEVKPAVTTNKVEKKKDVVVWRGQEYPKYAPDGGEAYITGYGVRYHSPVVITNNMYKKLQHWAAKHFKCPTDRRIAELIDIEPGTAIIGGLKYDPSFTKRFKASLSEPIVIAADDDEDVKMIKQAVVDVRKDLAARLEQGEDIGKVIHDTQTELQQLGAYKMELKRQVEAAMRKPTMTEQDLDDCLEAANLMLKDRGLEPLSVPTIFRKGIQLRERRMKEKKNEGK